MNLADVKDRMAESIDAFAATCNSPLQQHEHREMCGLLLRFADEWIAAAELDDEDINADEFEELMEFIAYFQDRVFETQARPGGPHV